MNSPVEHQSFYVHIMGQEQGPYDAPTLQGMVRTGQVKPDTLVRSSASGAMAFPAKDIPGMFSSKEWLVALLLAVFLGYLAVDRFYLGQVGLGITKLVVSIVTCGIGGFIWQVVDIILIATRKVTDDSGLPLR